MQGLFRDPALDCHFTGHSGSITQLRFSPEGFQIATSSLDGSVILWNLKQASRCIRFGSHSSAVYGVAWSPKGNLVASAGHDRSVKIWEPKVRGGGPSAVGCYRGINGCRVGSSQL
ncbi:GL22423 [Drosophila persimilis]|uniref:GL22423 n=1 Tax=Drosophila persimilis TaxID=7234 RepID=B4IRY2_DROPE|nr:GL22423 [Drosophila persimilis]